MSDLISSKSADIAADDGLNTVHCLMLPLHKEVAVLPNAAVAEIVQYSVPEKIESAPEWLLGNLLWRERQVPLVSFESISRGDVGKISTSSRIAILNTLNGNLDIPYVAIILQTLPSLQIVREKNINFKDSSNSDRQSVKAFVDINGVQALIPDIDEMESRLSAIHN